jgi:hypothetical protein
MYSPNNADIHCYNTVQDPVTPVTYYILKGPACFGLEFRKERRE